MKAAYQKQQAISAKAARARAYKAIRDSITPGMLASKSYVPQALRPKGELKGMDTSLTTAGPIVATTNTNANSFVLNLVQAGSGSWNRIGKRIRMKSARLRGVAAFLWAGSATTGNFVNSCLRMVVVYDAQPSSGAIPTFDTIFGVTDQSGTESSHVLAPLRYDNTDRFRVLRDVVLECPDISTTATGTQGRVLLEFPFDEYIKMPLLETVFSGNTNPMTIADISTGALYVYFRQTVSLDDFYEWSINSYSSCRLRYTDM